MKCTKLFLGLYLYVSPLEKISLGYSRRDL